MIAEALRTDPKSYVKLVQITVIWNRGKIGTSFWIFPKPKEYGVVDYYPSNCKLCIYGRGL